MSSNVGLRQIWITLRAVDYTKQAFSALQANIKKTQDKEKDLAKETDKLKNAAIKFVEAGLLTVTLGTSLVSTLWNLATSSREGAGTFARLNQQFFLTKNALADTAYEILKTCGVFDTLLYVLKQIQGNKALQGLIVFVIALTAAITIGAGAYLLYRGAMILTGNQINIFSGQLIGLSAKSRIAQMSLATLTSTGRGLGLAFGMAFASFTVFFSILSMLPAPLRAFVAICLMVAGAIVAIKIALGGVVNGMVAMGAIGGAMAGAASLAGQATGAFPIGTRSVAKTGLALVHEEERIYNPRTNLPTSVGNEIRDGNSQPSVTNNYISMPIENMNTKADFDDVDTHINKVWRRNLRNVR